MGVLSGAPQERQTLAKVARAAIVPPGPHLAAGLGCAVSGEAPLGGVPNHYEVCGGLGSGLLLWWWVRRRSRARACGIRGGRALCASLPRTPAARRSITVVGSCWLRLARTNPGARARRAGCCGRAVGAAAADEERRQGAAPARPLGPPTADTQASILINVIAPSRTPFCIRGCGRRTGVPLWRGWLHQVRQSPISDKTDRVEPAPRGRPVPNPAKADRALLPKTRHAKADVSPGGGGCSHGAHRWAGGTAEFTPCNDLAGAVRVLGRVPGDRIMPGIMPGAIDRDGATGTGRRSCAPPPAHA